VPPTSDGRSSAAPGAANCSGANARIVSAGHRGNRIFAQYPAQCIDLDPQVVFLDDHARPDDVQQLVLGQQLGRARDQRHEQIQCAAAHGSAKNTPAGATRMH